MICPECNGTGKSVYYVETDRDENTVTVEKKEGTCRTCNGRGYTKQTNADRIRAMSDEELVDFLGYDLCNHIQKSGTRCEEQAVCAGCLLEWLKQPAEDTP